MELKINDVVTFTRLTKTGVRRHKVRINLIKDTPGKQGQYCSYTPVDQDHDNKGWYGHGCGWFGTSKKYGIVVVAHHGNKAPMPIRHWSPRPGDTSYDLMC